MPGESDVPDDVWLSSAQKRDWASLVALLMALPTRLDAHLKQVAGINFYEYSVLVSLAEAPERTRVMSDLAVQARGSLSRLSHAVTRLETAGWVRRRSCGGAGRRTEVVLVEAGWQELQRIAPHHVDEVRRLVVDAIEPREFEQLGSAARHILACVDPLAATTLESAIGRLPRT